MSLQVRWSDVDWIAFDTETSGKYPFESEICEIAAVRWSKGQIVDRFESFVQVSKPMSDEVIAIHHITNAMLIGAPTMAEVLPKFAQFIQGGYLIGHHSPFDMGFLTIDFEKNKVSLPVNPVFCTSLLSRAVITNSPNHRLQTLVQHLNIPVRAAHRALTDAEACLDVALKVFQKMGQPTLHELIEKQGRRLDWPEFSVQRLKNKPQLRALVEALESHLDVQIEYMGGTNAGQPRTIAPVGIVLSPGQDFIVAGSPDGSPPKRFYMNKIRASRF